MSRYVCTGCGIEQDALWRPSRRQKNGAKRCASCGATLEYRESPAQDEGNGDLLGGSGGRTLDVVELMERRPRRREG